LQAKSVISERMGPSNVFDVFVVTDNMAEDRAAALESIGFKVIRSDIGDIYSEQVTNVSTYYSHTSEVDALQKMRVCSMKIVAASLVDYDAVLYLDADITIAGTKPAAFEMPQGVELMTQGPCCANAPLAAGVMLIRPNMTAYDDMRSMIQAGFSRRLGWGNRGLHIGPTRWPAINCSTSVKNTKWVDAYCKDPNTSRWDFVGAESDKGLFFAEYFIERASHKILATDSLDERHWWGPHKPWMKGRCANKDQAFWDSWHNVSRPAMRKRREVPFMSQCISSFDDAETHFQRCYASKQA